MKMKEIEREAKRAGMPTRRQALAGVAVLAGSLAAAQETWAQAQQPTMKEKPSAGADKSRTYLHQEVDLRASRQRIYEALMDSKQFAAFSGFPAEIDPKAGGAFTMFGGLITGRNVELIANQRIVQAWRPSSWDAGVYSIVRFELKEHAPGSRIILDHTGFPEGEFGGLDSGWHERYWEPMKKYFA
jgi:activator of HSP90 ATPase